MAKFHLTHEMLIAAYELLRTTPPFHRWKLPHADEVEFHVVRSKSVAGDCRMSFNPRIRINLLSHSNCIELIETMAHEMCHMRVFRKHPFATAHGDHFKYLAAQVCRVHGFNRETF